VRRALFQCGNRNAVAALAAGEIAPSEAGEIIAALYAHKTAITDLRRDGLGPAPTPEQIERRRRAEARQVALDQSSEQLLDRMVWPCSRPRRFNRRIHGLDRVAVKILAGLGKLVVGDHHFLAFLRLAGGNTLRSFRVYPGVVDLGGDQFD
jgi:hypothetical protein